MTGTFPESADIDRRSYANLRKWLLHNMFVWQELTLQLLTLLRQSRKRLDRPAAYINIEAYKVVNLALM